MEGKTSKPVFNKHATKKEKQAKPRAHFSRDDLAQHMAIYRSISEKEALKERAGYENEEREVWQDNHDETVKARVLEIDQDRNLEAGIAAGANQPEQRQIIQDDRNTLADTRNRKAADKIAKYYRQHFKKRPTREFSKANEREKMLLRDKKKSPGKDMEKE